MAVEGLKRIYETPYIKGRVDVVKEQPKNGEKKKEKRKRHSPRKEDKRYTPRRRGIIDIKA